MGTTAHGFPYPEGSDPVTDGPGVLEDLAEAVDTSIYGTSTNPSYGADMSASGSILFRRGGLVIFAIASTTSGAISAAEVIFTLPTGYRPPNNVYANVRDYTGNVMVSLLIETGGSVKSSDAISTAHQLIGTIVFPI